MGIKQLGKFLKSTAPSVMDSHHCASEYKDMTVAIDASPCLYQCMTAMGDTPLGVTPGSEADTSHVLGFLRRTVRLLELGIRPIFVFDGEAPEMKKSHALTYREKLRARSREQLEEAKATGDEEAVRRHAARLVKTTQKHNDDVMELLKFMGVPGFQADGEAERTCAGLAALGHADAAATEDMDALVFGAPKLLRNIHRATAQHQIPLVQEINLRLVLEGLSFNCQAEFVDFCILAGCDYLDTIPKIGIATAHQLVKKHRSIEVILQKLDRAKHTVPAVWDFKAARNCFCLPEASSLEALELKARMPDAGGLRSFLLEKHSLHAGTVDEFMRRLMLVSRGPDIQQRPPGLPSLLSVSRGPDVQPAVPQAVPESTSENSLNLGRESSLCTKPSSLSISENCIDLEKENTSCANSLGSDIATTQDPVCHDDRRPMPSPVRSLSKSSAATMHTVRPAVRSVPKPAAKPLPRGQQTLTGAFASCRRQASTSIEETSPRKRRRKAAVQFLEGQLGGMLGAGVVIPTTASLEELESLASSMGCATGTDS